MANISSDNKSGETQIAIRNASEEGKGLIDLDENAGDRLNQSLISNQLDDAYNSLPANKQSDPNINFLGSSFSGVDIKVIAHLYDTVNWSDAEISKLENEKRITDSISNGTESLKSGLGFNRFADNNANILLYEERRTIFIQATGLSESDDVEALQQIIGRVFRSGNFSFLGVARMKRDNESLLFAMNSRQKELESKIRDLKTIQSNSSTTVALGTLQTLSVQSHREKTAVRALGHSYVKGYIRGNRTIAGSMIFTIFNEHALLQLIRSMGSSTTYGERDVELSTLLPDQLPPIDLTVVFANEYGALSDFRLYGVEFVNDGVTYSIEDLLSEQIINFVCRDVDIMTSRGKIKISRLQKSMFNEKDDKDIAGSSLLFNNNSYSEYLDKIKIRRRTRNR